MGDVVFGFIHDFGPDEELSARRGGGAFLDGVALPTEPASAAPPTASSSCVGIESAEPRWVREAADDLDDAAYRVRALGTIAVYALPGRRRADGRHGHDQELPRASTRPPAS